MAIQSRPKKRAASDDAGPSGTGPSGARPSRVNDGAGPSRVNDGAGPSRVNDGAGPSGVKKPRKTAKGKKPGKTAKGKKPQKTAKGSAGNGGNQPAVNNAAEDLPIIVPIIRTFSIVFGLGLGYGPRISQKGSREVDLFDPIIASGPIRTRQGTELMPLPQPTIGIFRPNSCAAVTASGNPCKRDRAMDSILCWQHGKMGSKPYLGCPYIAPSDLCHESEVREIQMDTEENTDLDLSFEKERAESSSEEEFMNVDLPVEQNSLQIDDDDDKDDDDDNAEREKEEFLTQTDLVGLGNDEPTSEEKEVMNVDLPVEQSSSQIDDDDNDDDDDDDNAEREKEEFLTQTDLVGLGNDEPTSEEKEVMNVDLPVQQSSSQIDDDDNDDDDDDNAEREKEEFLTQTDLVGLGNDEPTSEEKEVTQTDLVGLGNDEPTSEEKEVNGPGTSKKEPTHSEKKSKWWKKATTGVKALMHILKTAGTGKGTQK